MTLPVNLPRVVKGALGFAKTCNKSHSLCSCERLSLALPNDHLCWDLSGHSTAHCAFAGQPLTAFTLLPHLQLASQEPQVRKGCFALTEIKGLPLPVTSVFAVQFQPQMRRVFGVGQNTFRQVSVPKVLGWRWHRCTDSPQSYLQNCLHLFVLCLLVPTLPSCFSNPRGLPMTWNNEELGTTGVSELGNLHSMCS